MCSEQAQILGSVGESESLFKVVAAVVIIEDQLVGGGCCEDGRIDVKLTVPDVPDNLLSVRILEQFDDTIVVDHVQAVPEVNVLFEQQIGHFFFVVNTL